MKASSNDMLFQWVIINLNQLILKIFCIFQAVYHTNSNSDFGATLIANAIEETQTIDLKEFHFYLKLFCCYVLYY